MVAELFSIVAPIFLVVGVGYLWARFGRPFDADLVTPLVYWVGAPCLVFSILANVELQPEAVAQMALATLVVFAGVTAAGYLALRLFREPVAAFLPSIMFGNSGNIGLPLSLLAFGETGLAFAITFFTVSAVLNHTVGPSVAAGIFSARSLLRVPMVYAAGLASIFLLTGTKPPDVLGNTTRLLAGLAIPLLLIMLGISLARLRVKGLARSVLLSLLRFGLGFGIGFGTAELFGLEGVSRGVLILQSTLPVAVFNFLFAKRFERSPDEVAGLVVVSTLMSFAILPVLIWFVLRQAGM